MTKAMSTFVCMGAALGQILLFSTGCGQSKEQALKMFINHHVKTIKPLQKQANLAWWEAATTGQPEAYQRQSDLELKLRKIYSSKQDFLFLKSCRQSNQIKDPLLKRQMNRLYNAYLENQLPADLMKQIVALSTQIQKDFSTFRGRIDGKEASDNEIKEILRTETDSHRLEAAWLASKQVGTHVSANLIRLVKLRNQAARQVGFDNYHTLMLTLGEQDKKELDAIFQQLYKLTDKPFRQLKAEMDTKLAKRYGITPDQLRPWHYQDPFFQAAPAIYKLNLDKYYENQDVKELARRFYDGLGLPVDSIIAHSDLYERKGKNPHAFSTDIDREGDVRVLCNLKNNEEWMGVILHEMGHAVYDKYHDPLVPYLLREPAHAFTTEGIAMFFGRLSRNADWMQKMLSLSNAERNKIATVSRKSTRLQQLVFARWAMVMYDFEKQLYADPDQDLNALWWRLVEKYQFIHKPAHRNQPDWAAKIHFSVAPCYYHNYLLGEMFASQVHYHLVYKVLGLDSDQHVSYVGSKATGTFLKKYVFAPGAVYPWNEMIKRATGEPLSPEYFVRQFVLETGQH